MDKKRIFGIILGAILVFAVCFKFYLDYKDMQEEEPPKVSDIKKFKEEYESLNGTKVTDEIKYNNLKIDEEVSIFYKSDKEILDVIENETGVIYLGFNSCPWCRSMIETLFQVIKDNKIDDFYYLDLKTGVRSKYEVKDKKLEKTEEGSTSFYKLLEILDEYLSDCIITDANGKEYNTGEKKLYAPTVLVIKNGEIVGFHEITVDSQTDPFKGLDKEQKEELYNIYDGIISKINDSSCEKPGC